MAGLSDNSDTKKPQEGETPVSAAAGPVPPKRLPWLWTILLLMTLPAVVAGLWYGGTRHRVEDHPKKVKPRPRNKPAMRPPMVRPRAKPTTTPGAMK